MRKENEMNKILFLQQFADYWCKLTDTTHLDETPNYPALYLREMLYNSLGTLITDEQKLGIAQAMCMGDPSVRGSFFSYCKDKNVDAIRFFSK